MGQTMSVETTTSMPCNISVKGDTVDYPGVCAYYNQRLHSLSTSEQPIQKLARAEGGFSIAYPRVEIEGVLYDDNSMIRQLRWNNRRLVPYWGGIPFTQRQLDLLAEALKSVHGDENIIYE